jgi:hypothetical protein
MPLGPGRYDEDAKAILDKYKAHGVLLIVLGEKPGMSVTAPMRLQLAMPTILRLVADEIEKELKNGV